MSEEERLFTWKHDTWCSIVNVIEKKPDSLCGSRGSEYKEEVNSLSALLY